MSIREDLRGAFQLGDEEILSHLTAVAVVRRLKKQEILLREGEIPKVIPLLLNGATRGFLLDSSGKDITTCFNNHRLDPLIPSVPLDAPATNSIEAVLETEVLCLPTNVVIGMIKDDPRLFEYYNRLLMVSLQTQVEIKNSLYKCTAMERYEWFLKRYPGLDGKISSKYIASFLNITTVSLSRLRKERRVRAVEKE